MNFPSRDRNFRGTISTQCAIESGLFDSGVHTLAGVKVDPKPPHGSDVVFGGLFLPDVQPIDRKINVVALRVPALDPFGDHFFTFGWVKEMIRLEVALLADLLYRDQRPRFILPKKVPGEVDGGMSIGCIFIRTTLPFIPPRRCAIIFTIRPRRECYPPRLFLWPTLNFTLVAMLWIPNKLAAVFAAIPSIGRFPPPLPSPYKLPPIISSMIQLELVANKSEFVD
jgi:hypothetical protein